MLQEPEECSQRVKLSRERARINGVEQGVQPTVTLGTKKIFEKLFLKYFNFYQLFEKNSSSFNHTLFGETKICFLHKNFWYTFLQITK